MNVVLKFLKKNLINFFVWIKKDHEDFKNCTKNCICKIAYEEAEVKVKDCERINAKYWVPAHQELNLNLSLSKKIPIVFHHLQNYNLNIIFQNFD